MPLKRKEQEFPARFPWWDSEETCWTLWLPSPWEISGPNE